MLSLLMLIIMYCTIQLLQIHSRQISARLPKFYTVPTVDDWTKYEDNKTYNGTLTIKNASGHVLATMKVSMTKVLPNTIPAGFSVKTAQVTDGIYNCYMIPMNDANDIAWTAETATKVL
mgnify:CR=1 FL=1